jgi:NAD(P)-dependent dehydrogenase (short-subunit alcohol dehydrogenase family)
MNEEFFNKIFNLKKKTAIVTGAQGQLGSSICRYLHNAGAYVIGVDKNLDNNKKDADQYTILDILDVPQIGKCFSTIFKEFGHIDILVNNAGVSTFEPFEGRPEDKFDWVMDVNLKGTFFCIQKYISLFDQEYLKAGTIVNIASMYGLISPDFRIYTDCDRKNSEVYGATKAGIIQMTKYFAVHLADRNIRVNAVSPGGVLNPNNPQGEDFRKNYAFRCPMKRMANENEIAGAVLYLAGDLSSYTTGHNLVVDGGMTSW